MGTTSSHNTGDTSNQRRGGDAGAELQLDPIALPPQAEQIDSLTGLPTREAFVRKLEACITQNPGNTALICIDVRGLKDENDRNGHEAGDEKLRKVSSVIRKGSDTVARLNDKGDEFAVCLSSVPDANANAQTDHPNQRQTKKITPVGLELAMTRLEDAFKTEDVRVWMAGAIHDGEESAEEFLKRVDKTLIDTRIYGLITYTRGLQLKDRLLLNVAAWALKRTDVSPRTFASVLEAYAVRRQREQEIAPAIGGKALGWLRIKP